MVNNVVGDVAPPGIAVAKSKKDNAGTPEAILASRVFGATEPARPSGEPVAEAAPMDKLGAVVASINDYLQTVRRDLEFSVNEDTGRVVVTVRNAETGEIVRQIPPEEVLNLAARIDGHDRDSGLLVQERA